MNPNLRFPILTICFMAIAVIALAMPVFALDGNVGTHDPTTIMECDGSYYAFGTGGATHVSEDGWTWGSGPGTPNGGGMGPDMIHIGDYFYMYTASNVGGQPASRIVMQKTRSLNPESPDYGWEPMGVVNTTDGVEFCNGIDPGCFYDENTGKFWLTFGSYFGNIRVVEMDPKTGLRIDMDEYFNIAINCEASTIIYHEGYYYVLATHGSCCQGSNSGYHIRTGRSKSVTGPYLDHEGVDMMQGGGKLVIGSGERKVGAGHFGLFDEGQGVQKFSLHWEADLDRGGSSVIDILPLVWEDGWPVAGEFLEEGTYQLLSYSTGTALELAVEGSAVGRGGRGGGGGMMGGGMMGGRGGAGTRGAGQGGGRRGGAGAAVPGAGGFAGAMAPQGAAPGGAGMMGGARGGAGGAARGGRGGGGGMMGGGMGGRGGGGAPVADQNAADVMANWPTGNIDARMANYMCQAQQKWTVSPAEGKGGYLGAPYYKIQIAGTDRALAAAEGAEVVTLPAYTGSDEQLWRIEQLTDGKYRIMPKAIPGTSEPMALSAIGASSITLEPFNPELNKQRWLFKAP
ncbi:MAG: family 43 glycosylhydrolase [Sedimentisphaerales bacterium]|nr:family 43 glycosylhydrolase [Sedimentisphaerales bacterium]